YLHRRRYQILASWLHPPPSSAGVSFSVARGLISLSLYSSHPSMPPPGLDGSNEMTGVHANHDRPSPAGWRCCLRGLRIPVATIVALVADGHATLKDTRLRRFLSCTLTSSLTTSVKPSCLQPRQSENARRRAPLASLSPTFAPLGLGNSWIAQEDIGCED